MFCSVLLSPVIETKLTKMGKYSFSIEKNEKPTVKITRVGYI